MNQPSKQKKLEFLRSLNTEVENRLVQTKKESPTVFKMATELSNLNKWFEINSKKLYE